MKYHIYIISSLILSLAGSLPAQTLRDPIDYAIKPLEEPSLSSAKLAIHQLNTLAKTSSLSEQATAAEIVETVRDIFTAEYQVGKVKEDGEQIENEAIRQDAKAADWMTPNAFGNVNQLAARQAQLKAKELRAEANGNLHEALQRLETSMRRTDALVTRFYEQNYVHRVVILTCFPKNGHLKTEVLRYPNRSRTNEKKSIQ